MARMLGDALRRRMTDLAARQAEIMPKLAAIAEGATLRAVEEAVKNTPPNTFEDGELRGANTITGELAAHWSSDSQTVPAQSGGSFHTTLANDQEYASYVNDGHRLDKHFVPGLYIDENGLLARNPNGKGGMMVGTKTCYVTGKYMSDKGVAKYEEVAELELRRLAGEVFR